MILGYKSLQPQVLVLFSNRYMKKKPTENYFEEIISLLKELKKSHPSTELSVHLSSIFAEYRDIWGVSDKEIAYAIRKYRAQLEFDVPHDDEIKDIIEDGLKIGKNRSTSITGQEDDDFQDGQHY